MKSPKNRLHSVMIMGATPAGIAAANKLGELGIPVTLVDKDTDLNEKLSDESYRLESGVTYNYANRPGLIRILRNSNIRCILPVEVDKIRHSQQGFNVKLESPRTYVDPARCTLCGKCVEICPVKNEDGSSPIHVNSRLSLPGRAKIDKRMEPLCQTNCPLGVNAQGYIALAKAGKYKEALDIIRNDNVIPAICGRVCTHPCEEACRRAEVDEPLAIRDIKRFISDIAFDENEKLPEPPTPARDEKIAVIGSGPAGIAAAADLARRGFSVTIFEKEKEAGGLLRYGIGPHRLPRKILDRELKVLKSEGVNIVTDRHVHIPRDLEDLKKKYNAVLLATGSWADRRIGAPGEELRGVSGCISFLGRIYRNENPPLGKKVAVIGDGNSAFDMARVLKRMGSDVTILSWFKKDSIPADSHDVKGAIEEGINIKDECQVVEFLGAEGILQGARLKPTQPGPEDENGIAWPKIVPGSESYELSFDQVIVAIGQTGAYQNTQAGTDLNITDYGYIDIDKNNLTGMKNVYAAGDAVTGATSVVKAMANGRSAAAGIMNDLAGITSSWKMKPERPESADYRPLPETPEKAPREKMEEVSPSARENNFDEVSLGFSEDQLLHEVSRCLQCGYCSQCLECITACAANNAIVHDETVKKITENAGVLIVADPSMAKDIKGEDVIRAYGPSSARGDVHAMIQRGFASAAKALLLLREASPRHKGHGTSYIPFDTGLTNEIRIGVFACRCNDSFGWSDEMTTYLDSLVARPEIAYAEAINSACIPEGVTRILDVVREKALTRVVLASCVCCPLDYVCSACTDQRSRLKDGLFNGTGISRSMVQTCNLRGEVLRLMEQDEHLAVESFKGLIDRSIGRAGKLLPFPAPTRNFNFTTAVIGQTEAALTSAETLAQLGFEVYMFGTVKHPLKSCPEHLNIHGFIGSEVTAISGTLGNFRVRVSSGGVDRTFTVGSVILGEKSRNIALYHTHGDLPGKTVQSKMQKENETDVPFLNPGATSISGLYLADPPGIQISKHTQGLAAATLAAVTIPRGPRQYRGFLVTINEKLCRSCGRCLQVCPYQAISLKPNDVGAYVAKVDSILCKGCGNCISVCPCNAADSPFRDQAYLEQTLEELLLDYRLEN
ncbi:MAG: FAD-dependent oxidoreductase [Desulfobacteraceae bacterium]|jgi:NADPH-dependent glutamate synthase beta subunit-like oxidoreductase/formate hydrogenlyase subunit 6/NADH:ubiquinone oxidoreductase subunit I